jgi:hypothetical protein
VSDLTIIWASKAKQSTTPKVNDISIMTPPASLSLALSFVFIGNSFFYFNNGINSYFGPMVTEGFTKLKRSYFFITISGSGLDGMILILIYVRTVSIQLIVIVQKH